MSFTETELRLLALSDSLTTDRRDRRRVRIPPPPGLGSLSDAIVLAMAHA
nr:hypothetical protein [Burkholderiaceae bacterium]